MKHFLFSRTGLVTILFVAVAGYFLWTEHQAHVIQYVPWALLAACPLMHLFMHRGHGSGHPHSSEPVRPSGHGTHETAKAGANTGGTHASLRNSHS